MSKLYPRRCGPRVARRFAKCAVKGRDTAALLVHSKSSIANSNSTYQLPVRFARIHNLQFTIYNSLLMPGKLEVSFNSPQCGWMSIGFADGSNEFHTTTAHAPHAAALPELMQILTKLADPASAENEYLLKWNRDPEEFDFRFLRNGEKLTLEIYQYPTDERESSDRELVFSHEGTVDVVCSAFAET